MALFSFRKRNSVNPEIRGIIEDSYKLADDKMISFVITRVDTKKNLADLPSREKMDEKKKSRWEAFFAPSKFKMTWEQLMRWHQNDKDGYFLYPS